MPALKMFIVWPVMTRFVLICSIIKTRTPSVPHSFFTLLHVSKYIYKDFTCPKNSAIHRIDTIYAPGDIKLKKSGKVEGIKVYCKDTNNGDLVKIKNDKTGILEDGIILGKAPIPSNKTGGSVIKEVTCNPIRYKGRMVPTFLSGVGAKYGIGVNALKFYNCSYKK